LLLSEILPFVSTNTSCQFQSQFMSTVLQNATICLLTDVSVFGWLPFIFQFTSCSK